MPPFIAFAVFAIIVIFKSLILAFNIGGMGEGNIRAFMACFYYFGLLYFMVALLTQYLIIVPVWNAVVSKSITAKFITAIIIGLVCAIFSVAIAYIIWDPADGRGKLTGLFTLMTIIQLAYWALNFLVMALIGGKPQKVAKIKEESE